MLNSLLALLNSRKSMRDRLEGDGIVSIHLSQLPPPTKSEEMQSDTTTEESTGDRRLRLSLIQTRQSAVGSEICFAV